MPYIAATALPDGGVVAARGWCYGSNCSPMLLAWEDAAGVVFHELEVPGTIKMEALKAAPDGSVYGMGLFSGSIDAGFDLANTAPGWRGFLVKFDPTGQVAWTLPLGSGWVSDASAMAVDPLGGVYAGFYGGPLVEILHVDENGGIMSTITQNTMGITDMDLDPAGNLWVTGPCARPTVPPVFGSTTFDPLGYNLNYNRYLVRYRPDGSASFLHVAKDVTCSHTQVRALPDGRAYWSGPMISPTTIGGVALPGPASMSPPCGFIALADTIGGFSFVKGLPFSPPAGAAAGRQQFLAMDDQQNAIIAGRAAGVLDWGNGDTTHNAPYESAALMSFSPQGDTRWAIAVDGTPPMGGSAGFSAAVAANGNIHMWGSAYDTLGFNGVSTQRPDDGFYRYVFHAVFQEGLSTGIFPSDAVPAATLYPNPVGSMLYLHSTRPVRSLECIGPAGQRVNVPYHQGQVDVSVLAPGLYCLRLLHSDGAQVLRFVKE